jgi:hypothetical protein
VFDIDPGQNPNLNFQVNIKNPKAITSSSGSFPVQTQQTVSLTNTVKF